MINTIIQLALNRAIGGYGMIVTPTDTWMLSESYWNMLVDNAWRLAQQIALDYGAAPGDITRDMVARAMIARGYEPSSYDPVPATEIPPPLPTDAPFPPEPPIRTIPVKPGEWPVTIPPFSPTPAQMPEMPGNLSPEHIFLLVLLGFMTALIVK